MLFRFVYATLIALIQFQIGQIFVLVRAQAISKIPSLPVQLESPFSYISPVPLNGTTDYYFNVTTSKCAVGYSQSTDASTTWFSLSSLKITVSTPSNAYDVDLFIKVGSPFVLNHINYTLAATSGGSDSLTFSTPLQPSYYVSAYTFTNSLAAYPSVPFWLDSVCQYSPAYTCSLNCMTCFNVSVCSACLNGYYLMNGACNMYPSTIPSSPVPLNSPFSYISSVPLSGSTDYYFNVSTSKCAFNYSQRTDVNITYFLLSGLKITVSTPSSLYDVDLFIKVGSPFALGHNDANWGAASGGPDSITVPLLSSYYVSAYIYTSSLAAYPSVPFVLDSVCLYTNNTISLCSANCVTCLNSSLCLLCQSGYFLVNGACNMYPSTVPSSPVPLNSPFSYVSSVPLNGSTDYYFNVTASKCAVGYSQSTDVNTTWFSLSSLKITVSTPSNAYDVDLFIKVGSPFASGHSGYTWGAGSGGPDSITVLSPFYASYYVSAYTFTNSLAAYPSVPFWLDSVCQYSPAYTCSLNCMTCFNVSVCSACLNGYYLMNGACNMYPSTIPSSPVPLNSPFSYISSVPLSGSTDYYFNVTAPICAFNYSLSTDASITYFSLLGFKISVSAQFNINDLDLFIKVGSPFASGHNGATWSSGITGPESIVLSYPFYSNYYVSAFMWTSNPVSTNPFVLGSSCQYSSFTCPLNCVTCVNSSSCIVCQYGYFLISGGCNMYPSTVPSNPVLLSTPFSYVSSVPLNGSTDYYFNVTTSKCANYSQSTAVNMTYFSLSSLKITVSTPSNAYDVDLFIKVGSPFVLNHINYTLAATSGGSDSLTFSTPLQPSYYVSAYIFTNSLAAYPAVPFWLDSVCQYSSYTVSLCASNCLTCVNSFVCIECRIGYILVNGICVNTTTTGISAVPGQPIQLNAPFTVFSLGLLSGSTDYYFNITATNCVPSFSQRTDVNITYFSLSSLQITVSSPSNALDMDLFIKVGSPFVSGHNGYTWGSAVNGPGFITLSYPFYSSYYVSAYTFTNPVNPSVPFVLDSVCQYSNNTISLCSTNCLNCLNSTVCTVCQSGYVLVNSVCFALTSLSTQSKNPVSLESPFKSISPVPLNGSTDYYFKLSTTKCMNTNVFSLSGLKIVVSTQSSNDMDLFVKAGSPFVSGHFDSTWYSGVGGADSIIVPSPLDSYYYVSAYMYSSNPFPTDPFLLVSTCEYANYSCTLYCTTCLSAGPCKVCQTGYFLVNGICSSMPAPPAPPPPPATPAPSSCSVYHCSACLNGSNSMCRLCDDGYYNKPDGSCQAGSPYTLMWAFAGTFFVNILAWIYFAKHYESGNFLQLTEDLSNKDLDSNNAFESNNKTGSPAPSYSRLRQFYNHAIEHILMIANCFIYLLNLSVYCLSLKSQSLAPSIYSIGLLLALLMQSVFFCILFRALGSKVAVTGTNLAVRGIMGTCFDKISGHLSSMILVSVIAYSIGCILFIITTILTLPFCIIEFLVGFVNGNFRPVNRRYEDFHFTYSVTFLLPFSIIKVIFDSQETLQIVLFVVGLLTSLYSIGEFIYLGNFANFIQRLRSDIDSNSDLTETAKTSDSSSFIGPATSTEMVPIEIVAVNSSAAFTPSDVRFELEPIPSFSPPPYSSQPILPPDYHADENQINVSPVADVSVLVALVPHLAAAEHVVHQAPPPAFDETQVPGRSSAIVMKRRPVENEEIPEVQHHLEKEKNVETAAVIEEGTWHANALLSADSLASRNLDW